MNKKQTIRINESQLRRIVSESVKKLMREGTFFNHKPDEFGRDYFEEAKEYANGIVNCLTAIQDEGNADSYEATSYLYHQLEDRVIKFNQTFDLIKKYFKQI